MRIQNNVTARTNLYSNDYMGKYFPVQVNEIMMKKNLSGISDLQRTSPIMEMRISEKSARENSPESYWMLGCKAGCSNHQCQMGECSLFK